MRYLGTRAWRTAWVSPARPPVRRWGPGCAAGDRARGRGPAHLAPSPRPPRRIPASARRCTTRRSVARGSSCCPPGAPAAHRPPPWRRARAASSSWIPAPRVLPLRYATLRRDPGLDGLPWDPPHLDPGEFIVDAARVDPREIQVVRLD